MADSVGRASLNASAGTLLARIIGFGRNLALAAAIGTGLVSDSYNIANQVPYQIFLLLGGGTIATIFVPQLMRHARTSTQRSEEYGSVLIYAGAAFGIIVTALLLAFSPIIIRVMGGSSWGEAQSSLALQLSVWCIPQVFFYTIFSVTSQLMNAKGFFSAVAWLPAANSAVIILACVPIIFAGAVRANSADSVSQWEVALLGGSTLLGAVLQSMLLVLLLYRAGFRLRFRFRVRGLGLRATAVTGVLTIVSAAFYQMANLTTSALSTQAGTAATLLGFDGRGFTTIFYAQALLYVAQAVASASIANILLQRLARHYANGDDSTASSELNDAILRIGAFLIPIMFMFICVGPLTTELLFTRGETDVAAARFIGVVLAVLALGLVPFALQPLLIRPFYAVRDAVTPLRSAGIVCSVWVAGSFAASRLLPSQWALLGIAGAFSLAYTVDLPLKLRRLRKKLDFNLSSTVLRAYGTAFGAGLVSAAITGAGVVVVEPLISQGWAAKTMLLAAALAIFLAIYYPLTARSPTSLRRLVLWLRT